MCTPLCAVSIRWKRVVETEMICAFGFILDLSDNQHIPTDQVYIDAAPVGIGI
jgi:hypothetical protein